MSVPRSVALERTLYTLTAPVLAAARLYPDSPVNTVVQLAGAAGIGGWILAPTGAPPTACSSPRPAAARPS
ncbi:hypothetical protein ACFXMT_43300 [Streptomyces mirabilis]|uniref:hypothetical protein n=1 Tax=Streptomyces mirabilis TaxID=68239 RepID=UPI0036B58C70